MARERRLSAALAAEEAWKVEPILVSRPPFPPTRILQLYFPNFYRSDVSVILGDFLPPYNTLYKDGRGRSTVFGMLPLNLTGTGKLVRLMIKPRPVRRARYSDCHILICMSFRAYASYPRLEFPYLVDPITVRISPTTSC